MAEKLIIYGGEKGLVQRVEVEDEEGNLQRVFQLKPRAERADDGSVSHYGIYAKEKPSGAEQKIGTMPYNSGRLQKAIIDATETFARKLAEDRGYEYLGRRSAA